jgi:hypothetical protein
LKGLLWDYNAKLNKNDIYFRKQDMLMRNATIPESEKYKINQKMKFQAKHSNILSIPNERKVRNKFDDVEYHG